MSAALHRSARAEVSALSRFTERIDVRSPREHAEDHVPGARSHPVLDDEERARVGTLHAASSFAARRLGAALIARNIARMLEEDFRERGREWQPLVYCWRGGQRSRALVHILNEIGWHAVALDGGYRAYRRHVIDALETAPAALDFIVLCGLTGSGKSRLLAALGREGAQTLDLEGLASHRGSLLGAIPEAPQPSQKRFESALLEALRGLDPARPVFVESESRRIGVLQVPDSLLARMRAGRAVELKTRRDLRVALLHEDYEHVRAHPAHLGEQLSPLVPLLGKRTIERWQAAASAGDWVTVVDELLDRHYDPVYARSLGRNFVPGPTTRAYEPEAIDDGTFAALARTIVADHCVEPRNQSP